MRPHARIARAELVLARPAAEPLRSVPLSPDPLAGFAATFAEVAGDETLTVDVDLLPVSRWQAHRARRRLLERADRDGLADVRGKSRSGAGLASFLTEAWTGQAGRPQAPRRAPLTPTQQVDQRLQLRELASKLSGHSPLFELQVLIRAESPVRERARQHVRGVVAAFDAWAGENHLRVSGRYVLGVPVGTANAGWRRGWFDYRVRTGRFAPAGGRGSLVTAREIGPLLRPPTATNLAPNVLRAEGIAALPRAPRELPTWTLERHDLLPLGVVQDRRGERIAGVPLQDSVFSYFPGRSRFGKTELALVQFVSLAAAGEGALFLDPHHDALDRAAPYLAANPAARDRVIELDLTRRDRQPGWNPIAMAGRSLEDLDDRVQAVVDAIATTQGWGTRNSRALNLVTKGAEALCELSLQVGPADSPTLFELLTLLSDDDWRTAVLPFLRPSSRSFWEQRFPKLPGEAITAVTNLLDRLRASRPLAAMLGQPVSTVDLRAAMDAGSVVLACPGGGAGTDQIVANLWFYDTIRAAKSRRDVAPGLRRRFWLFLDEAQAYDGAASGNIATLLEQCAKFGLRATVMNQDPERLPDDTLAALMTNRSHLITTSVKPESAARLAKQWAPRQPTAQTIAELPRYHYAAQITLAGAACTPFGLRGMPLEDTGHGAVDDATVRQLRAERDDRLQSRRVGEVLAELETHPMRVLEALRRTSAPAAPPVRDEPPTLAARNVDEPVSQPRHETGGRVRMRPVTPTRNQEPGE